MTVVAEPEMDLRLLFPGLDSVPPLDVVDIASHSGEVVPGGLFLACAGTRAHGLRFLDDALRHGARAVVWEPTAGVNEPTLPGGVVGLAVPGLGHHLGDIANRFFAKPSSGLSIAGITGTNGKTTVAWLLAQALETLGRRAAYMGTLGYGPGTRVRPDALTTPGCVTLHRRLREFADAGTAHLAMEVSSHALDQGRVDGVSFRIVAFTNLTRDHLDYHGDIDSYGRAKARLLLETGAGTAVINIGDPFGRQLAARLPAGMRLISVSVSASGAASAASLQARCLAAAQGSQRIVLEAGGTQAEFVSPLLGAFNVENLAVAAGILLAESVSLADIANALAAAQAPPGRMELIRSRAGAQAPRVIVDFAHTPDALRRVLEALRAHTRARIWCVFGCGGDRDAGKRAAMGAIARELADRIVVTDDNPRFENPDAIVRAVLQGAGTGPAVEVIRDRAAAIRHAIRSAGHEDIVLIAGKGHESAQIVGAEARPFSDQMVASAALAETA
jgi:UDP-N-acetylmuramoyl-L-alanyl-D-glutamate--2,6-diaminopimelate ligase